MYLSCQVTAARRGKADMVIPSTWRVHSDYCWGLFARVTGAQPFGKAGQHAPKPRYAVLFCTTAKTAYVAAMA
jgi:hypothetical protein